ncbi:MAG: DEAD/DEAH box helicase [Kiritimatiellae bacterium]|nr:DEAD/DEAH box helicase [Kiritimatiellia bacterium]
MNLTTLFRENFPANIRQRGQSYLRQGRVEIEAVNEEEVRATVRGSRLYEVELLKNPQEEIRAYCSCLHFAKTTACKHLWALLLELDAISEEAEGHAPDAFFESRGEHYQENRQAPSAWDTHFRRLADYAPTGTPDTQFSDDKLEEVRFLIDANRLQMGEFVVQIGTRTYKKNGQLGKPRIAGLRLDLPNDVAEPYRSAVALLVSAAASSDRWSFLSGQTTKAQPLPENMISTTLAAVLATGRCHLTTGDRASETLTPALEDDLDETWRCVIKVDEVQEGYTVTAELVNGEASRPLSDPLALTASGYIVWPESISRLGDGVNFGWIVMLRKDASIHIPADMADIWLERFHEIPGNPETRLPLSLQYEELQVSPQAILYLREDAIRSTKLFSGALRFLYGETEISEDEPKSQVAFPQDRKMFTRDIGAERAFRAELKEHRFTRHAPHPFSTHGVEDDWSAPAASALRSLSSLMEAGWHIYIEGKPVRRGRVSISVKSGLDWFDVAATYGEDREAVSMPDILHALSARSGFVKMKDGSLGVFAQDEDTDRLAMLAKLGQQTDDVLRLNMPQVFLLDALLGERPGVNWDKKAQKTRADIREKAPSACDPHKTFIGTLRDYQKEGLGWLHYLRDLNLGGCLADDMGLGKTVQALALLLDVYQKNRTDPSLIVIPKSLIFNWCEEAARFTPKLRVMVHHGKERAKSLDAFQDADLILTTYSTMRLDITMLVKLRFHYVILDEAQAIKNASSATAKAARLLNGTHRLAMSGTPIENHLGELWSLFEFLNPGMLGGGAWLKDATARKTLSDEACALVGQAVRPFILRRTKGEVATELPAKTEETILCELPAQQRAIYNDLRSYYQAALAGKIADSGLAKSKIMVLEALLRLRQAACHPGLVNDTRKGMDSAKLSALMGLLEDIVPAGHKVLIFSQFTKFLALVRQRLDAAGTPYAYLDGRTRDRQARVREFQEDPDCPVFLISLKAGGVGLNLTAADYVILLDPWWNPAVEAQAIDRAHRIGQERHVFAYRLVAKDTVEEKILELQERKRGLADAIITQANSLVSQLTADDLNLLLS